MNPHRQSLTSTPNVSRIDSVRHPDYLERTYAGLLGKFIGVYLGRPVENWSYERIQREIGDVSYYIHEQRNRRLIITDDDISGTLTFLRALEDYGYNEQLTPAQIGQTWLNYLIEETTILWWGGLGNSTEHTAYLRLKAGIKAPESGSEALNSRTIAEQIGGQIFIDGWGLINPGDAERAADFARRAASVSHDGEGIFGAQVIAGMVAHAFCETDINTLLDVGLGLIPQHSVIQRMCEDLREWHARDRDWRNNRARLEEKYGYHRFKGQCHIVPNHGLIVLSLLHGEGDFDESMKIINTCGWDTDCNAGNLGTILGVRNGLQCFERQDWRGPVADRIYLPSADGGRSISNAASEAIWVANAARLMRGYDALDPGEGKRFHFKLSGSTQGWHTLDPLTGRVYNPGHGPLVIECSSESKDTLRALTPTFIPPHTKDMVTGYVLVACPTLYSGHTVEADLVGLTQGSRGRLYIEHYGPDDESICLYGPSFELGEGEHALKTWLIPDTHGFPIHCIGIELEKGGVGLASMDWSGVPSTSFPPTSGTMWGRAWAKAVHRFQYVRDHYEYMTHNSGMGLLVQGAREWQNYCVSCRLTPRMCKASGIAVRVQGLERYYAFLFGEHDEVKLIKVLDGKKELARVSYPWKPFEDYQVTVEVDGNRIRCTVNGELILQATDSEAVLTEGAFAFIIDSGCLGAGTPKIEPL